MPRRLPLLVAHLCLFWGSSHAQLSVPPVLHTPSGPTAGDPSLDLFDSKWQLSVGSGLTVTSGNSRSTTMNVNVEATRITDNSKLGLTGRGLYAKSNSKVVGSNLALVTQYDRDLDPLWFGFARLDHMTDRPANISARRSFYLGFGHHLVRTDANTWDIATGLGYTHDQYVAPTQVANALRTKYGRTEAVLTESSSHKLTTTTTVRQKLGLFQSLQRSGAYRMVFDGNISVSITTSISLTTGLTIRHDSGPTANLKKTDTLFVTGLAIRLD